MISISIPAKDIPECLKHSADLPVYSQGNFYRLEPTQMVSLTDEFVLDNMFDPNNFFICLSGNEFTKLMERDEIPNWISLQQIINYSTAHCTVDESRKIKWFRPKLEIQ